MQVLRRMTVQMKSMSSSPPASPQASPHSEPVDLSLSLRSLNFGASEDDVDTIFPQQLCDSSAVLLVDDNFSEEISVKDITGQCKTPEHTSNFTPSTTPSPSKLVFPMSIFIDIGTHNISGEESKKIIAESAHDPKILLGWQVLNILCSHYFISIF